ncbi:HAD-IA family hydrolase [Candidatus Saccharibacteria bacterium]|nr:HAD-IA family hydrolase [Candidatus Saccharibacteria bacterium]
MIRALVFDCFGVVLTDALQELRAELALRDVMAAEEVRDIVAANNRGLIAPHESNQRLASIFGMPTEVFRAKIAAGEVRNEQLLQYIGGLRKHYKTAMLSNIAGSSLARRFPDEELSLYFDEVLASADIGYMKPDKEAYEIAAERLGVELNECIFIDDREAFCAAAKAAGMQAILYTDFAQFTKDLEALLSM